MGRLKTGLMRGGGGQEGAWPNKPHPLEVAHPDIGGGERRRPVGYDDDSGRRQTQVQPDVLECGRVVRFARSPRRRVAGRFDVAGASQPVRRLSVTARREFIGADRQESTFLRRQHPRPQQIHRQDNRNPEIPNPSLATSRTQRQLE